MKKRDGFSAVEIVMIIAVAVIVGTVGWMAYSNLYAPKSTDETSQKSSVKTDDVTVKSESDLDKVDTALNDINLDDTDSAELDAAVDKF